MVSPSGLSYIGRSKEHLGEIPAAIACKRIHLDNAIAMAAKRYVCRLNPSWIRASLVRHRNFLQLGFAALHKFFNLGTVVFSLTSDEYEHTTAVLSLLFFF